MSRHRFFINPQQIHKGLVTISGDQARQIAGVLRLTEGDTIHVLDNQGWGYELKLERVKSVKVVGRIQKKEREKGEPALKLTLYQSLLKRGSFEWVLQKGTELGVTRFVPMISRRTIVRQKELKKNKRVRWQRIITEAAEQSGRGIIPILDSPVIFPDFLPTATAAGLTLIPWEKEEHQSLRSVLKQYGLDGLTEVVIIIGPEGGFSEEEIDQAQSAGAVSVTLGSRILRAETAAVVAGALVLNAFGEMG